jgi:hypothetical protein
MIGKKKMEPSGSKGEAFSEGSNEEGRRFLE